MKDWADILRVATLGTAKAQVEPSNYPQSIWQAIPEQLEPETALLQLAAAMSQYYACGTLLPVVREVPALSCAAEETAQYCDATWMALLSEVLETDSDRLLIMALDRLLMQGKIVAPEFILRLLGRLSKNQELNARLLSATGNRGKWLLDLNPVWKATQLPPVIAVSDWSLGDTRQRRELVRSLRMTDPVQARSLLEESWGQENAREKAFLLELLKPQLSEDDLPLVEKAAEDRSKQVRAIAQELLRLIPGSAVIQSYTEVIRSTFSLLEERSLIGWKKKRIQLNLPDTLPEAVVQSGIESVSTDSKFSDAEFQMAQLIAYTPPETWEKLLNLPPAEIWSLFSADRALAKYQDAIQRATLFARDSAWAEVIYEEKKHSQPLALLLETKKMLYVVEKLAPHSPTEAVELLEAKGLNDWSLPVSKAVLTGWARGKNYNREAFLHIAPNLHPEVAAELDRGDIPAYYQGYWDKTAETIRHFLSLKQRIQQR